jgi:hypothetical protein
LRLVVEILFSKSRYKPKPTECFNDPAFIEFFSQQLCLDAERSNDEANSCPNASASLQDGLATPPAAFAIASLQDGLATPPATFTELPDNLGGSSSPVVGKCNIVLQDSTIQASCDNATAQPGALIKSVSKYP